jgi:hypothetical protein
MKHIKYTLLAFIAGIITGIAATIIFQQLSKFIEQHMR